jgi:hypothetical protein
MAGPAPFVIASNSPQTIEVPTSLGLNYTLASAGTVTPDIGNQNCRGLVVFINLTGGSTPSLTVTVQGKDPVSGQYYTILASAAITSNGLTALRIYPGIPAAANSTANDVLPSQWRISAAITGTVTATVSSVLLP